MRERLGSSFPQESREQHFHQRDRHVLKAKLESVQAADGWSPVQVSRAAEKVPTRPQGPRAELEAAAGPSSPAGRPLSAVCNEGTWSWPDAMGSDALGSPLH